MVSELSYSLIKTNTCALVHGGCPSHICLIAHLSLTLVSLTKCNANRLCEAVNASSILLRPIGMNLLEVIDGEMKSYAPGCLGSGTVSLVEVARPGQVSGQVYFSPELTSSPPHIFKCKH